MASFGRSLTIGLFALGLLATGLACGIASAQPDFIYHVEDQTAFFQPGAGTGSFTAFGAIQQNPASIAPPIGTQGFSMGLGHDPQYLEITGIELAPIMANLNGGAGPDFFAPTLLSNGVTLGLVYSFMTGLSVEFIDELPVVELEYATVPATLQGVNSSVTTSLTWTETLSRFPGSPVVENQVAADGFGYDVLPLDGTIELEPASIFVRGDVDGSGNLNLVDVIVLLGFLFVPGNSVPCDDAADVNDSGSLSLPDAITLLIYLFSPTSVPPTVPFPSCGEDPTADLLECNVVGICP